MVAPAALRRQQPPVGAGAGAQSVAVQAVPSPRQVPCCVVQLAWVVWMQAIWPFAVTQHAPVGVVVGQGVAQVVPGPRKRPWREMQSCGVVTMHWVWFVPGTR
jgi:hypothetical protein